MKRLIIILSFILIGLVGYSQVSNVPEYRIANDTTAFGKNIPIGTRVYDIGTGNYWVATAGVLSTATLTTAAASFDLLNDSGTGDQTAIEVNITDAGGYYTGTTVEAALQESGATNATQQTAIDLNTAKQTNVSTQLSTGTVTGTTYGITSDGGADDVILAAATPTLAGVMTAADKTKLDGIEAGGEVNLSTSVETFEEISSTPTAHALAQTGVNVVTVSLNGATLNPADYTFTSTTITLDGPVFQYDAVTITYNY